MADAIDLTTDGEIDAALERAALYDKDSVARNVQHVPGINVLLIYLSNGRRLTLPVEDLQGLSEASPDQLTNVQIHGAGSGIGFPDLDVDLYVPALIEGVYGTERWMRELNDRGSSVQAAA